LESLPTDIQIGGAILVAGFSQPIHFTELNNFFETPLDYHKCQSATKVITLINSDNDEHVPLEQGILMEEKLSAKLIVINNGGHLNAKAGFTELPVVLSELLAISTN